jgi:hypothetical protein
MSFMDENGTWYDNKIPLQYSQVYKNYTIDSEFVDPIVVSNNVNWNEFAKLHADRQSSFSSMNITALKNGWGMVQVSPVDGEVMRYEYTYAPKGILNTSRIYVNDTLYIEWKPVIFEQKINDSDTQAPNITVLKPFQNATHSTIAPTFEISILEPYINATWYSLFNGTWSRNIFFLNETQINQESWNLYPNGSITLRFYANDTSGNLGWADVLLNKIIVSSKSNKFTPTPTPPPYKMSGIGPLTISLIALVSITILVKKSTKKFSLRVKDRS